MELGARRSFKRIGSELESASSSSGWMDAARSSQDDFRWNLPCWGTSIHSLRISATRFVVEPPPSHLLETSGVWGDRHTGCFPVAGTGFQKLCPNLEMWVLKIFGGSRFLPNECCFQPRKKGGGGKLLPKSVLSTSQCSPSFC